MQTLLRMCLFVAPQSSLPLNSLKFYQWCIIFLWQIFNNTYIEYVYYGWFFYVKCTSYMEYGVLALETQLFCQMAVIDSFQNVF